MSHGKAGYILRKSIMFSLVKELSKNKCFRCNKTIDYVGEFSIDHILDWETSSNPKELFFDLSNITFSHLKCNIQAGKGNLKGNPNYTLGRDTNQKLTIEEVQSIKQLLIENKLSQRDIAKKYNIHHSTVQDIYHNRSWKDIEIARKSNPIGDGSDLESRRV